MSAGGDNIGGHNIIYMINAIYYVIGIIATVWASSFLGFTAKQLMAIGGFSSIFFGAIFFWRHRLVFAFFGVGMLLTLGLLDVPHVIEFAGIDIVLFLISMMIIIGFLEEKQFFEHLVNKLIAIVGSNGHLLFILLMVASFASAALVDEVTSILFMSAAMLNLTSRFKLNPIPFIIMIVFATNVGSSATVIGNPVGVIIALRSGLGFMEFLRWAAPISLVVLVVTIGLFYIYYARPIRQFDKAFKAHKKEMAGKAVLLEGAHLYKKAFIPGILFACVILGLVFHAGIEHFFALEKNTMLLGSAILGACAALALHKNEARGLVEKRVDWWTLAFFLFLFASVGTLKYQGITGVLAQKIMEVAGNNVPALVSIFIWASGALTSVIDNVLAVSTFVPIVKDIGTAGVHSPSLWWAILFGSTILGNLTIIGSTANMVAVGVMERRKLGQISFLEWLKAGVVVAIPSLIVAHLLILAQLKWMVK